MSDQNSTNYPNNNPKGKNQYKDCPSTDDPRVKEILIEYQRRGITDRKKISKLLLSEHGITLSETSVARRRKTLGLFGSINTTRTMSASTKRQLVVDQMTKDPTRGPRSIREAIMHESGVMLTRDYIASEMRALDPTGFVTRNPHAKKAQREPDTDVSLRNIEQLSEDPPQPSTSSATTHDTDMGPGPEYQDVSYDPGYFNNDQMPEESDDEQAESGPPSPVSNPLSIYAVASYERAEVPSIRPVMVDSNVSAIQSPREESVPEAQGQSTFTSTFPSAPSVPTVAAVSTATTSNPHNYNPTGKNQYKDRPAVGDSRVKEILTGYQRRGITDRKKISDMLRTEHGITMSETSVARRRKALGLQGSAVATRDTPETVKRQLILAQMAKDPARERGPRSIREAIAREAGVILTRDYIASQMRLLDPDGFKDRHPQVRKAKRQESLDAAQ